MFNTVENVVFKNISATPPSFTLRGGNYAITAHATWGGGSITLQRAAPDGTLVTVITAITADSFATANLPSGTYTLTVATATGIYCDIVSTVTTM